MIAIDDSVIETRGDTLNDVWWRGRQWAVTAYGLERRDGLYPIEKSRLREGLDSKRPYSWIAHMRTTLTADVEDFATAFFVACAMHGAPLSPVDRILLDKHYAEVKAFRERDRIMRPYLLKAESMLGLKGTEETCLASNIIRAGELAKELAREDGAI